MTCPACGNPLAWSPAPHGRPAWQCLTRCPFPYGPAPERTSTDDPATYDTPLF